MTIDVLFCGESNVFSQMKENSRENNFNFRQKVQRIYFGAIKVIYSVFRNETQLCLDPCRKPIIWGQKEVFYTIKHYYRFRLNRDLYNLI